MVRKELGKKQLERHLLNKFISNESLGLRILGIRDGETPDFIVEELNRQISIEMTRLIHPDLIQVEKLKEKIVRLAMDKFKEKYSPNLLVLVDFTHFPLQVRSNTLEQYVNTLYMLVESIYLPNEKNEFNVSFNDHRKPINDFIDSISVSNVLGYENWQPFRAFKVNQIDVDWLKNKIVEKEQNIGRYPQKYPENWLLLVANFGHKSSTHSFDFLEQETFDSSFDKVFLYKYNGNTIFQLK